MILINSSPGFLKVFIWTSGTFSLVFNQVHCMFLTNEVQTNKKGCRMKWMNQRFIINKLHIEPQKQTCMFWTTLLNWDDLWVQVLTRSMDRSKFFTYSPYIFIKGASFWRMSPMRGFDSLEQNHKCHWKASFFLYELWPDCPSLLKKNIPTTSC